MAEKKLWAGRFSQGMHKAVEQFTASLHVDHKLWRYDVQGSIAHCRMLGRQKIIAATEAKKIIAALQEIGRELESGKLALRPEFEDIHMLIESRVFAGQERIASFETFRYWLKLGAGFVDWMQTQRWDIGIAPLAETGFNRCTSAIKALDCAALGLADFFHHLPSSTLSLGARHRARDTTISSTRRFKARVPLRGTQSFPATTEVTNERV